MNFAVPFTTPSSALSVYTRHPAKEPTQPYSHTYVHTFFWSTCSIFSGHHVKPFIKREQEVWGGEWIVEPTVLEFVG